jgi:hypothetical protein
MVTESSSAERIALPYRIRVSNGSGFPLVGGSFLYASGAQYARYPWRSLGLSGLLLVGTSLLLGDTHPSDDVLVGIFLFVGCLCVTLLAGEILYRRDYLTSVGLERQYGLFGRKRIVVPYSEIRWATVEEPGGICLFDMGDVVIRTDRTSHRLSAVREAHTVASAIESLSEHARTNRDQTPNPSLQRTIPARSRGYCR